MPSLKTIFDELDGALVLQAGIRWELRIWGIHEIGVERWIQMSASGGSTKHDLVLRLACSARVPDIVASLESWLGCLTPASRIIQVF